MTRKLINCLLAVAVAVSACCNQSGNSCEQDSCGQNSCEQDSCEQDSCRQDSCGQGSCGTTADGAITHAAWMAVPEGAADKVSSWSVYRKTVTLRRIPKSVMLTVAADSKYWLSINGEQLVFEGGLKRGPRRNSSSYYDQIEIAPYLHRGDNQIEILAWYFGKSGFSHVSSGKAAVYVAATTGKTRELEVFRSGKEWSCAIHPSYGVCGEPLPNYRLPESCVLYDATKSLSDSDFVPAEEVGSWGDEPWGEMVARPIPMWRDYGICEGAIQLCKGAASCQNNADKKGAANCQNNTDKKGAASCQNNADKKGTAIDDTDEGAAPDTIKMRLPYNMQMTPIIELESERDGAKLIIRTDHTFHGATDNIRAEYIAHAGRQSYESLGWMNGEELQLIVPQGVHILSLAYRQTGYDSTPTGSFSCSDEFYNKFWQKGLRTLYVNMRDTFFDCPDRERAQWWGDVTVMMGELFYTYDMASHELMRKGIRELCDWQKEDGSLSSPIPGNYNHELPGQMLAAIGRFGFWTYYEYSGDLEIIRYVWPSVQRYLQLWELDETGLTKFRKGGWTWGDWGSEKDLRLIYGGLHYMALDGAARMAEVLEKNEDAALYRAQMDSVKTGYQLCWDGEKFRHPDYKGLTDDRVQALAVVAGIADAEQYDAIFRTLQKEEHASPYMEKYVMEALFMMGQGNYALQRAHKRFGPMVDDPERTTLFEGWELGSKEYGGGTSNHAWSGGALTVLGRYLCGIRPVEPGFREFEIRPQFTLMNDCSISVPTAYGHIESSWASSDDGNITWWISVPKGTKCHCCINGKETVIDASRHGKQLRSIIRT